MKWETIFLALALISAAIMLWQFAVAFLFPLRRKISNSNYLPSITILKPIKGADKFTEECLKSWLEQDYKGQIQFIFAFGSEKDPGVEICERLATNYPHTDISILICDENRGSNSKISKLVHAEERIKHEIIVVSDADVKAPPDLLSSSVRAFMDEKTGLICCLYSLANPENMAMRLEAVAINSDFWSQVLQARSLKPINFALGAVMMIRRKALEQIGGFKAVVNKLADDYWLGRLINRAGWKVDLSVVPVELYHEQAGWKQIWAHQLRWARTIRVCEPAPYFFSIISNVTLWAVLYFLVANNMTNAAMVTAPIILLRALTAAMLCKRLTQKPLELWNFYLPIIKDIIGFALWIAAFFGNHVKWRGKTYRVFKDGTMKEI
jgi:ceramide glucosyltransferase